MCNQPQILDSPNTTGILLPMHWSWNPSSQSPVANLRAQKITSTLPAHVEFHSLSNQLEHRAAAFDDKTEAKPQRQAPMHPLISCPKSLLKYEHTTYLGTGEVSRQEREQPPRAKSSRFIRLTAVWVFIL